MLPAPQRFPFLSLLLGLILGAAGGLAYAWFLNPVNLINIDPGQLSAEDQRAYMLLVGEAYRQDRDLERARARLVTLRNRDVTSLVAAQADRSVLNGADLREVCALGALAEALGGSTLATELCATTAEVTPPPLSTITPTFEGIPTFTPTPADPTITPTPHPPTPTPTLDFLIEAEFQLVGLESVCDGRRPPGRIEIYVSDSLNRGIPGVEVRIEWEGQQDTFFTGLKPEVDPGYADFQMQPNKRYTVTLVNLTEPVIGRIDSTPCGLAASGEPLLPVYILVFAPAVEEPDE